MRKRIILCLIMLVMVIAASAQNSKVESSVITYGHPNRETIHRADSIMRLVISNASRYKAILSGYEANIYVKGHSEILRENVLMRFAHKIAPVDLSSKDMLFEMKSKMTYTAPNSYVQDIQAVNGNTIPNQKKQSEVFSFLNFNVYSPTIYDDEIITPVASNARKLYKYNLISIEETGNLRIFRIRFVPKQPSQKLTSGDLYIVDKRWTIDKIELSGRVYFAEFNILISFGRNAGQFVLPEKADLFLRYNVLGNSVISTYHSSYTYNRVEWFEDEFAKAKRTRSLDLTQYLRLENDTVQIVTDSSWWNQERDLPLTADEKLLLNTHSHASSQDSHSDTTGIRRYMHITSQLTDAHRYNYNTTFIRYSGLLNPMQLGYSQHNGVTYKQRLRVNNNLKDDKQLRFLTELGYMTRRKELFFKVGGEWEYSPEHQGTISLSYGKGNDSYSSAIAKQINQALKDTQLDYDDVNLKYFRHYYTELKNDIEIFNGFHLFTTVSYHRRMPVKGKTSPANPGEEVKDLLNKTYYDFTPTIGFSFTPRQYYRMDGRRKEYVYSHYPTISFEFARGINGVMRSSGNFERFEADIHQSLTFGVLRKLNYHFSGGLFTRQKSTYFADFDYFTRHNFPDSWNDKLGGVFNILSRVWFNASDKYLQAHFMYESPFILIQPLRLDASKHILSERFYLSQLWTPVLPSYTEMGYGFGNYIFNIALFAGFNKLKYQNVGVRFAFELE
jgi:hypothetical protein